MRMQMGRNQILGCAALVGILSGSAYIFRRNAGGHDNWGQVMRFAASDTAAFDGFGGEWFERAAALSGDTALIGASGNSDAGFAAGSAYIFDFAWTIAVDIDIKPDTDVNSINPDGQGNIPVIIFGSDTFDVADVDVTTLAFGRGGASLAHIHGPHEMDANRDSLVDLLAHFRTQETGIGAGDDEVCITGKTLDGTPFEGCDAITTVSPQSL